MLNNKDALPSVSQEINLSFSKRQSLRKLDVTLKTDDTPAFIYFSSIIFTTIATPLQIFLQ